MNRGEIKCCTSTYHGKNEWPKFFCILYGFKGEGDNIIEQNYWGYIANKTNNLQGKWYSSCTLMSKCNTLIKNTIQLPSPWEEITTGLHKSFSLPPTWQWMPSVHESSSSTLGSQAAHRHRLHMQIWRVEMLGSCMGGTHSTGVLEMWIFVQC